MTTSPAHTRTGGFSIGLRLTGSFAAQPVVGTASWAKAHGFACVDLHAVHLPDVLAWAGHGLTIGTIDLFSREWTDMLSADEARRRSAVALGQKFIREAAAAGVKQFFTLMLAEDVNLPRTETFGYMVESYGQLRDVLRETGTRIAIEGWPGCNAHCCTPESYRAFLKEMNSPAFGINYDPSHLIRMGIDPLRFLKEFAPQVVHVHGKDTLIDPARLYDLGHEQAPVFAKGLPWGGSYWRYTIPGAGCAPWADLFEELKTVNYQGFVSIELEDMDHNGTFESEQRGFLASRDFLQSV